MFAAVEIGLQISQIFTDLAECINYMHLTNNINTQNFICF